MVYAVAPTHTECRCGGLIARDGDDEWYRLNMAPNEEDHVANPG